MKQQEFFALALLTILFTFISFFYANDPNITGFSFHEANQKDHKITGTYTIKPHFSTQVDYDLNIYDETAKDFPVITTCVEKGEKPEHCIEHVNTKNTEDLRNCVALHSQQSNFDFANCIFQARQAEKTKNYEWTTYCDEGEERLFYDFAKTYQDCFDSEDTNCLCTWDYRGQEYIEQNNLGREKYTITMDQDVGPPSTITLLNEKNTLRHIIQTGNSKSFYLPNMFSIEYGLKFVEDISLKFKTSEWNDNRNLAFFLYKHETFGQKRVDFVRNKGGSLEYPERDGYVLDEQGVFAQTDQMRECQKPPQNTYRFCVKQAKEFVARNDITGKVSKQPIIIKLAAFIPDPPPLPVRNVQVMDRVKDDRSLILMWEESKEEDVASYKIYYQQDTGLSPLTIQEEALIEEVKRQTTTITLSLNSLKNENDWTATPVQRGSFLREGKPFCEYTSGFFTAKKCRYLLYDDQRDEINNEELYKLKFDDEETAIYLYSLPLDPQFTTDFLITAVDDKGNEIKKIEQANDDQGRKIGYPLKKGVEIVDDLPPSSDGIVTLFSELFSRYDAVKKSTTFPWINAPTENIDGSPVTDFRNQYEVHYSKNPSTAPTDEWTLSQFDGTLTYKIPSSGDFIVNLASTNPQVSDKYYLIVVAKDGNDNPEDSFKLKELETREISLTISSISSGFTEPIGS